ncbi:MAG: phosphoenolpyruvate--protein phosphotransferase [Verrucomicrobia bacterium]|nr:phosphoenolpyruvate--protein phosphotransferase [Verrucomicrobiota bacterium]
MTEQQSQKTEHIFRGVQVSPGIARGVIYLYGPQEEPAEKTVVAAEDVPKEFTRFEQALIKTRQQLTEIPTHFGKELGSESASIFDAHLLVLDDPMLTEQVFRRLEAEKINVEWILQEVADLYFQVLSKVEDSYLRERAADVRDVARRIMRNLRGEHREDLQHLPGPRIVVAQDLSPSDTALMDRTKVLGFATDAGSRTSHTAIIARSQGVPAVVAMHDVSQQVATGDEALLDGYSGLLIINPTQSTLYEYGQIEIRHHTVEERLALLREKPAQTRDGRRIELAANIEFPDEAASARDHGAEGIGLYRTEFLFLNRRDLPGEDEQFAAYQNVAKVMSPHPVIIRTIDIGGDKLFSPGHGQAERNPFLGWRGVRFSLDRPDVFKLQIRAALRAGAEGNIKLMYPMISCLSELERAAALLNECKDELRREGRAFNDKMEVGAMVEVPSAALVAEQLAGHVNFFSIGTNDLIQYTLAVDRVNERVAHLYAPTFPAVLRLIKMVVDAARAHKIWVGVCGEMAGDPLLVPLLLGLGADELSMSAVSLPLVKFVVRAMNLSDAQALADRALRSQSPGEVQGWLEDYVRSIAPEVVELVKPKQSATP